jgi:hypothetical protein
VPSTPISSARLPRWRAHTRSARIGPEAVHRALVRHAQNELGSPVGVPNDVGFENFDWPSLRRVRDELEALGIGYGVQTSHPGRFYEYPGDPIVRGVGTPVSHTGPQ